MDNPKRVKAKVGRVRKNCQSTSKTEQTGEKERIGGLLLLLAVD